MAKFITRFETQRLKNETHVQFNESIDPVLVANLAFIVGLSALYQLYKASLITEVEALDYIRRSDRTKQIATQDHVRDKIFSGFAASVKGAENHYETDLSEAAEKLHKLITHYGNISRKSLDDETAAINDLLRELQTPSFAAAVDLLGFKNWTTRLADENARFEELMRQRYSELAERTTLRMQTVRGETDKYYHAIINFIENLLLVGTPGLDAPVRELNVIIDRFKHILAQEKGERKSTDKADDSQAAED
jgi:hypothetical protein